MRTRRDRGTGRIESNQIVMAWPVGAAVLCVRLARLKWAMADEFEQQLERIEGSVAEIVEAVQKLREQRAIADEAAAGDINQRLRRFLERKKQA